MPKQLTQHRNPRYPIQLSARMIIALVDASTGYNKDDSPLYDAWSFMTCTALTNKGLISSIRAGKKFGIKLTEKGTAYLKAAQYEYKTARALIAAAIREAA